MKDILNYIKKSIIIAIIILFVAIIFIVFKYDFIISNNKSVHKEESNIETPYKDFTSYDKKFSIRTSKDWKEVKERYSLNKDAIMELYNEKNNAYFLLVINPKIDYKNDYNSYKNEVFKQKEEQYNIKIDEIKKVVVNDYEWQYIEFNYVNENKINTYIRSYAIETTNYYGQIIVWTIASNEEKISNEFNNIIDNLVEV